MRLAVLLLSATLLPGQQPAAQPSNCAADGFVVNSVTGEPIPRALVQISGPAPTGTVADSAGRWKASALACGRINVTASKTGFLPAMQNRTRGGDPLPVVAPDSPVHDLRIELTPQSVITGKVLDEAGDPVQNAQVSVLTSRVVQGRRSYQQTGGLNTNDLGEYRLPGLPAGKAIVCANAMNDPRQLPGDSGTVSSESCYPGPAEGPAASAMTLMAGQEARVDFTLRRVPAARIHGKVTGMPENAGAIVSLQHRATGRVNGQARQANMLRDGSFELRGVAPGAWTLSVDYWESGKRLFARVPVDVGGADLDGVVVHLEPGFTVTGAVRVESQSGKKPNIQQMNLFLRSNEPMSGTGTLQWDKEHTGFTINDVMPGNYELSANLPAPFYLKSAMMGGVDLAREPAPFGQAAAPIDVVIADDAGSVEWHLVDTNGEAVSGWVMAWRDGHPPIANMTASDGKFKLLGVAPGDYRVFGWDDFQQVEWADADWMRRNGGSGVVVSLIAGQSAADAKVTRVTVPHD